MIAKSILLFIFGVSIGSFINVIRYRYKKVQSIIIPRSYCDNCKKKTELVSKYSSDLVDIIKG